MCSSYKPIICCGFTPAIQRIIEFTSMNKGMVNRAESVVLGIGGKGANTARVTKQLGADPLLIEFAGGSNSLLLEELLNDQGIRFEHVTVEGETRICQTLIESGNPEVTELVEEMPAITSDDWQSMLNLFHSHVIEGAVVTISGKLPAGAPVDGYATLCRMASENGGRVILDTQGVPLLESLNYQPFMVKINDDELRYATGCTNIVEGVNALIEKGAQSVLITRGRRSVFYFDQNQRLEFFPPLIQAVNPVGSGDSVTAGLAVALSRGDSIKDAIILGVASGSANALNRMSGYIQCEDVVRFENEISSKQIN